MAILLDVQKKKKGNCSVISVSPSLLYLSYQSAKAWLLVSRNPEYRKSVKSIASNEIVKLILNQFGSYFPDNIEIISLGCGEPISEIKLIQAYLQLSTPKQIDLRLVDINSYLLEVGAKLVKQKLSSEKNLKLQSEQTNFLSLPKHYYTTSSCQLKIVTLLGNTFGNLCDEQNLLEDNLCKFSNGTILLMDFGISRRDPFLEDPWLSKKIPWWEEEKQFLSVPLQEITFSQQQFPFFVVPKILPKQAIADYSIEVQTVLGNQCLAMQRFKRYNPQKVVQMFQKFGWSALGSFCSEGRMLNVFIKSSSLPNVVEND